MFIFTLVLCRAQCLPSLSLGLQRKLFVCVMLFYSQTESLHNTAEVIGRRVGLIGMKRGLDRKSVV